MNLTTLGNVENIQLFVDKGILNSEQGIAFRNFSSEKSLVYDANKLSDLLGSLRISFELVDFNSTAPAQSKTPAVPSSTEKDSKAVVETGKYIKHLIIKEL